MSRMKWICWTVASMMISGQALAATLVLNQDEAIWSDPSVWDTGWPPAPAGFSPGASDTAIIREGYTAYINSDVGTIVKAYIGDAAAYGIYGTVVVKDGGKIISSSATEVGRRTDGSIGTLQISGGEFWSGSDGGQAAWVGIDGSDYHTTGLLEVKGTGTFIGRAIVGSNEAGDSGDVFRIVGSDVTVGTDSTLSTFSVEVRDSGRMEWVFDKTGIATADFEEIVTFASGSEGIIIDGKDYIGEARTFTLLKAGTISSTPPSITLTNFTAGATYNWDSVTDTLTVSVEDSTIKTLRFSIIK